MSETAPQIIPGAEPYSAPGGSTGVLVIHGFTGSVGSMRSLAEAFAAAGHTVEAPRLPGHGTQVSDMLDKTWADWTGAVDEAYRELAARVDRVFVAGLSMGGSLTLWLALHHPEIAGIICINPATRTNPDMLAVIEAEVAAGKELMDGIASDIAKEGVEEIAYAETPLRPLLSLMRAADDLSHRLGEIEIPLILFNSPQDHVVDPGDSDFLAESVSGPVERVTLPNSYHVATQDHDAPLIEEKSVEFVNRLAGVGR